MLLLFRIIQYKQFEHLLSQRNMHQAIKTYGYINVKLY